MARCWGVGPYTQLFASLPFPQNAQYGGIAIHSIHRPSTPSSPSRVHPPTHPTAQEAWERGSVASRVVWLQETSLPPMPVNADADVTVRFEILYPISSAVYWPFFNNFSKLCMPHLNESGTSLQAVWMFQSSAVHWIGWKVMCAACKNKWNNTMATATINTLTPKRKGAHLCVCAETKRVT